MASTRRLIVASMTAVWPVAMRGGGPRPTTSLLLNVQHTTPSPADRRRLFVSRAVELALAARDA